MIDFSNISYEKIFDIFNSITNEFIPDNIKTFKPNDVVVYSIKNGVRYRIVKNFAFEKPRMKFSIGEEEYIIARDKDNFVKKKQNPPISSPVEHINTIIKNLGIDEKLVYSKMQEFKDLSIMISML